MREELIWGPNPRGGAQMSDDYTDEAALFEIDTVTDDYGDEAEWFIDIINMYEEAKKKANMGTPLSRVVLGLCN
jgi:hypothetical protein